MRVRTAIVGVALTCAGLVRETPLRAHRLDEYLQATRVMIASDRVTLEMDLTAGVAVAPAIFKTIDTDGSGAVSTVEADAYAAQVIASLVVALDDRPLHVRLDGRQLPAWFDMRDGVGSIHLEASAELPKTQAGDHHLYVRNTHRSEMSVYLANALVPDDDRVAITNQRRDLEQHELTIDYRLSRAWPVTSAWPIAGGLLLVGLAALVRVQKKNSRSTSQ